MQEYIRTRVCNTTHWGLARRNFKSHAFPKALFRYKICEHTLSIEKLSQLMKNKSLCTMWRRLALQLVMKDSTPQASPFSCDRRSNRWPCVCLPFNYPTFLPFMHPLRAFPWRKKKKKRKAVPCGFRFCIISSLMSQRSTAQHCQIDTQVCTIHKSHIAWNFAVPVPHREEIRRCILLFLCSLAVCQCYFVFYFSLQAIATQPCEHKLNEEFRWPLYFHGFITRRLSQQLKQERFFSQIL